MKPAPSQSAEDYLERILELIQETGQARVVDIANSLNIRHASVTNMVKKLCEMGFVDHEKYKRGLVLTETGREVAQKIQRRHETLSRFFSLLELDDEIQRKDIEGIEHHLSRETVRALEDLVTFFEHRPKLLKEFLNGRKQAQ